MKIQNEQKEVIEGVEVYFGEVPAQLLEGYSGLVYYFKTLDAYEVETHEKVVKKVIKAIENYYDEGTAGFTLRKIECPVWESQLQISVASFRWRDSY
ncbi:hypothetical protein MKX73_19735 [Solibacillus sp. FSL W7-1436]|uniref:hypothetical protein n=1 Tax=Solibacillus sp. FSL W7-1436 TaxID=2921705 RepID=UPI0030F9F52B